MKKAKTISGDFDEVSIEIAAFLKDSNRTVLVQVRTKMKAQSQVKKRVGVG